MLKSPLKCSAINITFSSCCALLKFDNLFCSLKTLKNYKLLCLETATAKEWCVVYSANTCSYSEVKPNIFVSAMAASWLICLVILAVNVLIAVVLVKSNSDFCASVFKTQTGKLKPVALMERFSKTFSCFRSKQNIVQSRQTAIFFS